MSHSIQPFLLLKSHLEYLLWLSVEDIEHHSTFLRYGFLLRIILL